MIQERLASALASRDPSDPTTPQWLEARSVRPQALAERRLPTARELDDAVGDHPTTVHSFDYHAMSASSRVLALMGITRDSPNPQGGVIERTPSGPNAGEPTGVLLEQAAWMVRFAKPATTDDMILARLRAALADLRARGIVEAHDMRTTPATLAAMLHLIDLGELGPSAGFALQCYATPDHFDACRALLTQRTANNPAAESPTLGLKLFTDGTLNARTASMLDNFIQPIDDHPKGLAMYTDDQLDAHLRTCQTLSCTLATHSIGDASVRQILNAYDRLQESLGEPPSFTLRIEHAQFIHEDDIPRFARPGQPRPIIASLQPCHLLTDIEGIRRFTPHAEHRAFPLRDLIHAAASAGRDPAAMIYLGSDAPIVEPSITDNQQAAVHRRRPDMPESQAIAPDQAITQEAWAQLQASPAFPTRACTV